MKSKVLNLVKGNVEVILFIGILIGMISLIVYNCLINGTNSSI
jgi:ABC-type lipoprotein release transport system permease subunit